MRLLMGTCMANMAITTNSLQEKFYNRLRFVVNMDQQDGAGLYPDINNKIKQVELILKSPSEKEFEQICDYIREFELDNRGLKREEFVAAIRSGELVGFGRLRHHADCIELCSLGVITPLRRQGIGKAIVQKLVSMAPGAVYLSCIIPDFFIPFGFRVTENYPASMKEKLHYCIHELVVPEKYVIMVLNK